MCWRSGSARATRSRPSSSAQAAIESLAARRDLLRPQPGPARTARGGGRLHERPPRADRARTHRGHVGRRQRADAGDAGAGGCRATRWWRVTPVWPNLTAQPAIMGARLKCVSLKPVNGAWTLDMGALLAAVTPATKLLIVNAPNNPTGWTLTRAEQQADPGPLPPHRHLDPGRRGVRTPVLRSRYREWHARRVFSTWPRRTTGWWWCTASPRAFS